MRSVTAQQIKDFREQQHYFTLTFSDGTVLTNEDIVLDSVQITRTLCDSEQLAFNTVYATEFNVQIFNDGKKYDGLSVTVNLTAGTYSANLGTYYVASNPRSNDRLYRSLVAYDSIAAVLSKDYKAWHNSLKASPPATVGAYRTAFFSHIGITQASTVLCNDATAFNFAEANGALSGATILGELCSINGTFGYLDFDQTFKWFTPYIDAGSALYPALTLYPSATLYPMSVEAAIADMGVDTYDVGKDYYDLGGLACEEFVTENITQVYMHMGDVVYASGTEGNRLTVTNTLFTMDPNVAVQAVANIKATVKDFNYTPTSITMLATPWLELGDVVVAEVSDTEQVYFPVLNFIMTGTGAIRQTIEAKGVRVNSDEATSTDYKIITASNSADYAAELARQAQQTANTAQEAADTAQESADTAQETAETAQTAADTAQQAADDAQTAADTAQETADNAQTAADTAQETADTAQETAEEAQQMAEDAAKVATNYLHFSNNKGLIISQTPVTSDAEAEALTASNSRVTTQGFDVYKNGTTRVAHFGESTVIGQNGNPQQTIDNTSMAFTDAQSKQKFLIQNDITGTGENGSTSVEINNYLDGNNVLDPTLLAQEAAYACDGMTVTSASDEYAISTDNIRLWARLRGYARNTTTYDSIEERSEDVSLVVDNAELENGVLTVTVGESSQADWTGAATAFASMFPSGYDDFMVYVEFDLFYEIKDAQMTLGTRATGTEVGAKSVSIGSNNEASETGSVAIGRGLTVRDPYSVVVGDTNNTESERYGSYPGVAFGVGANFRTPFAVLKNGTVCMSSDNMGKVADQSYPANSKTDVAVTFKAPYPFPPFVFLTLTENNIPASALSDYASTQIYLKSVTQDGFVATVVNGGSAAHSFAFNWLAFSIL